MEPEDHLTSSQGKWRRAGEVGDVWGKGMVGGRERGGWRGIILMQ